MHGAGPALRNWMLHASTWQRLAVAVAMVAAGAVGLLGVLLLYGIARRWWRERGSTRHVDTAGRELS